MFFSKTYPSFLTVKEGSTFLTKPLFPQGREDVTALRCSEPLRYKVGGPIKGLRQVVRDGTAWNYRFLYKRTAPFGTFILNSIPILPSLAVCVF